MFRLPDQCERTSAPRRIRRDLQTALMDDIQRLRPIPPLNHTRDINLRRPLRDHPDIHIPLRQRREHPPRDPQHMVHLFPHEGQDRHVLLDDHLPALPQLLHELIHGFFSKRVFDGHADVDLARADQVDGHAEAVEGAEDLGEEAVRVGFSVGVDVEDDDAVFDRHRGGESLRAGGGAGIGRGREGELVQGRERW